MDNIEIEKEFKKKEEIMHSLPKKEKLSLCKKFIKDNFSLFKEKYGIFGKDSYSFYELYASHEVDCKVIEFEGTPIGYLFSWEWEDEGEILSDKSIRFDFGEKSDEIKELNEYFLMLKNSL